MIIQRKTLTQEETKFWSKTNVHLNFLLYSCVVGFVRVLWVYVKVVWFANVEHIYLVLCVLWVYMKVVWCASVWTYCSSEWSFMKNISFRKHNTIKQKQLSEIYLVALLGSIKMGNHISKKKIVLRHCCILYIETTIKKIDYFFKLLKIKNI
jgi:hypothetical protein